MGAATNGTRSLLKGRGYSPGTRGNEKKHPTEVFPKNNKSRLLALGYVVEHVYGQGGAAWGSGCADCFTGHGRELAPRRGDRVCLHCPRLGELPAPCSPGCTGARRTTSRGRRHRRVRHRRNWLGRTRRGRRRSWCLLSRRTLVVAGP